jgi:hypothetical protein
LPQRGKWLCSKNISYLFCSVGAAQGGCYLLNSIKIVIFFGNTQELNQPDVLFLIVHQHVHCSYGAGTAMNYDCYKALGPDGANNSDYFIV